MLFSIIAVALSSALLIVVGSLFGGFISTLENTSQNFIGDIVLTPNNKFTKYSILIDKLQAVGQIKAASPVLNTYGLLHLGKGKVFAVNIWGVEPISRSLVSSNFKQSLLQQKNSKNPPSFRDFGKANILDGFVTVALLATPDAETDKYDFQKVLDEYIGKKAILTSGSIAIAKSSSFDSNSSNNIDDFKIKKILFNISDVVFTGISQIDSKYVYLPIELLSESLYGADSNDIYANTIHIKVAEGLNPKDVIPKIWNIWSDFAQNDLGWGSFAISNTQIETSMQLQAMHIAELQKQLSMLMMIFGIISCAAILLIACIFYMIVITRTKDIAIIKSFGAAKLSIMSLFVYYGLLVGIIGAALGVVLGCVITKNINEIENWIRIAFGLKLWDSSVYLFSQAPNIVDWSIIAWVFPFSIAASAIGAAIPAVKASKIKPVKILQYE